MYVYNDVDVHTTIRPKSVSHCLGHFLKFGSCAVGFSAFSLTLKTPSIQTVAT